MCATRYYLYLFQPVLANTIHLPLGKHCTRPVVAVAVVVRRDPGQVDPQKAAASLFSRLSLSRFLPARDGAHTGEKEKEERGPSSQSAMPALRFPHLALRNPRLGLNRTTVQLSATEV
ncbi:hypothetical protein FB451DRAFT_1563988 [Mycena latifolia]|nr:hypothetical protein FB451DRAFT_1563988 [Mycena latifolia]